MADYGIYDDYDDNYDDNDAGGGNDDPYGQNQVVQQQIQTRINGSNGIGRDTDVSSRASSAAVSDRDSTMSK